MTRCLTNALLAVVVSSVLFPANSLAGARGGDSSDIYPLGDPRRCLRNANKGVKILDVLPGSGWDNLQNTEAGMVLAHNFSKCRMTEDRRYVIPDWATVYAVKTYLWESNTEEIHSTVKDVSITARGVNMDSHFDGEFDISGTFSGDIRKVNTDDEKDMSLTNRIQRRYVGYKAVIQPEMPLTSTFRVRLMAIALALKIGDSRRARYASQQLVREYGTHVIVGVEAGTVWIQDESISHEVSNTSTQSLPFVSVSPKGSVTSNISQVNMSGSGYARNNARTNTSTVNNSTVSTMRSFGGSPGTYPNMREKDWVESFTNNLVAVDRTGEPIDTLVQPDTLPELSHNMLLQLNSMVKEAIQSYYKINTYPGCTDRNAANFSPEANADDGSCWKREKPQGITTVRFGGVFQTCNSSASSDPDSRDLCSGLRQVNPSTGLASCPAGYETAPLYRNTQQHYRVLHDCQPCWMGLFKCCRDVVTAASAEMAAFWCFYANFNISTDEDVKTPDNDNDDNSSEEKELPAFPGFLFGGTYTSRVTNVLTSAKTCPRGFLPLTVGEDINICVSDGGDQVASQAVNFAGFFSCSAGNPLSVRYTSMKSPLFLHTYSRGPTAWPRQCPRGYSPYMTTVLMEDGCEIYHCIQPRTGRKAKLPKLRRPPFARAPLVREFSPGTGFVDPSGSIFQRKHSMDGPRHTSDGWNNINAQRKDSGGTQPNYGYTELEDNMVFIFVLDSSNVFTITVFVSLLVLCVYIMLFIMPKLWKGLGPKGDCKQYQEVCVKT